MIDENFQIKSIMLCTHCFVPRYGERKGGIRRPFKRWIVDFLRDFEFTLRDLYGATSDAGPDVKWMMADGLKLKWQ
ncbi:hypothetical protein GQ600_11039 [Phytophthora cactorum]|nr:hypothetical protein GQ600_11039 [Phytophthora cactorum]